jgi:hypothetical protein
MGASSSILSVCQVPVLLRGEPAAIDPWIDQWDTRRVVLCVTVTLVGAGLYGAAMGWWRAPLQGFYTAVKFPLIILLTTLGHALLNGVLAPLLGVDLRFRQSFLAILVSFTIAAAILGAFSPLMFFVVWNLPPLVPGAPISTTTYVTVQLMQVGVIAFAGVAANLRLVRFLRHRCGCAALARNLLLAWLAGNLFLGSQVSWILRPFIGLPGLPLQFLRPNAFQGNFYETVIRAVGYLISP